MIRRSNQREQLIGKLSALIPGVQAETHDLDDAAARHLGINRTDLRCLGVILERGPASASMLAETMKLTRAAMTTVLDRLEQAAYIHRVRDGTDRRRIKVEATQQARKAVREIWAPIRIAGLGLLTKYTSEDLQLLIQFFEEYCTLQKGQAERIRNLG